MHLHGYWRCIYLMATVTRGEGTFDVDFYPRTSVERIFSCRYMPRDRPTGGVVIAPTLHAEAMTHYRRESLLAECLCERRTAVLRFHYRGTGHSDGDSSAVTIETMAADVVAAVNRIKEQTSGKVVLVASRLGALAAAAATPQTGPIPLVLWEPVLEVSRYFREAFRAARMQDVVQPGLDPIAPPAPLEVLQNHGVVDILGYPLTASLYESATARTPIVDLGDTPRRILIIQSEAAMARERGSAQSEKWRQMGWTVDTLLAPSDTSWWLAGNPQTGDSRHDAIRPVIVRAGEWITHVLGRNQ